MCVQSNYHSVSRKEIAQADVRYFRLKVGHNPPWKARRVDCFPQFMGPLLALGFLDARGGPTTHFLGCCRVSFHGGPWVALSWLASFCEAGENRSPPTRTTPPRDPGWPFQGLRDGVASVQAGTSIPGI